MYQPGTILELREPRSTEDEPFAYDRVKVIGVSPVNHAQTIPGQWQGVEATGVLIQPAGDTFGPNLDEPVGKLQELYEIVEIPESDLVKARQEQIEITQPGPSPEEVFKAKSRADSTASARKRQTTPLQNDGKTPEEVLQENALKAANADKPKRGRRAKPEESTD